MKYVLYTILALIIGYIIKVLVKVVPSSILKLTYLDKAEKLNFEAARSKLLDLYNKAKTDERTLVAFGLFKEGNYVRTVGFYEEDGPIHWDFREWPFCIDGPDDINRLISEYSDAFADDPKVDKMVLTQMISTQFEASILMIKKLAKIVKEDIASQDVDSKVFIGVWDKDIDKAVQKEVLLSIKNHELIDVYLDSYGVE